MKKCMESVTSWGKPFFLRINSKKAGFLLHGLLAGRNWNPVGPWRGSAEKPSLHCLILNLIGFLRRRTFLKKFLFHRRTMISSNLLFSGWDSQLLNRKIIKTLSVISPWSIDYLEITWQRISFLALFWNYIQLGEIDGANKIFQRLQKMNHFEEEKTFING